MKPQPDSATHVQIPSAPLVKQVLHLAFSDHDGLLEMVKHACGACTMAVTAWTVEQDAGGYREHQRLSAHLDSGTSCEVPALPPCLVQRMAAAGSQKEASEGPSHEQQLVEMHMSSTATGTVLQRCLLAEHAPMMYCTAALCVSTQRNKSRRRSFPSSLKLSQTLGLSMH